MAYSFIQARIGRYDKHLPNELPSFYWEGIGDWSEWFVPKLKKSEIFQVSTTTWLARSTITRGYSYHDEAGSVKRIMAVAISTRALARVAVLGVSYFGLTMLLLSLLDTDYNPISQAASDYGVGRFAIEMNLGFLVGGIGLIAFALAVGRQGIVRRSKAASVLLFVAGLVLIMDSYFTTNVEGGPATVHGTIHGFEGLVFFITAPIGVLLVSRKLGRGRTLLVAVGLIVGFTLLAANAGLSGLAERIILLVLFSSVIVAAESGVSKLNSNGLEPAG